MIIYLLDQIIEIFRDVLEIIVMSITDWVSIIRKKVFHPKQRFLSRGVGALKLKIYVV